MRLPAPLLAPVFVLCVALPALGACSSDKKTSSPSTSTTATSAPASTISSPTTAAVTSTTKPTGGVTTSSTAAPHSVFTSFTISPASPVECNAPTMVELKWTTQGASSVILSIDGVQAGIFGGGPQDHLQYFACDGKKHTYTLTAKVGATTQTTSRDVTSKAPS